MKEEKKLKEQEKNDEIMVINQPVPPTPQIPKKQEFYRYFEINTNLTIID